VKKFLGEGFYFPYFSTNCLNKFHFSINHFQGILQLPFALKLGAQVESKTIFHFLVFLYQNFTAFSILKVLNNFVLKFQSLKIYSLSNSIFLEKSQNNFSPVSGNKTILSILYSSIVLYNSVKLNQESSFQINIVHIFFQKVFIAAIADSGVEAIESLINFIHLKIQISSCLCSKPVKSDKTFFIFSIFFSSFNMFILSRIQIIPAIFFLLCSHFNPIFSAFNIFLSPI